MNNYFELTEEQQRIIIIQTSAQMGIPPQAVEKDLWVSIILKIVFTLPFSDYLVFKGGTSLSKSYGLIDRFSEDIDLVIDREYFGLFGDLTKRQIKNLRKQSSLFVKDDFSLALRKSMVDFGLDHLCDIVPEPDGEGDSTYPEPRKIHVRYKSLFQYDSYLNSEIMLEIGARSLFEPTEVTTIKSFISAKFDHINTDIVSPQITTSIPAKTFLEKAFLLHELFTTGRATIADRKSRHLYDLEKMMDHDFARQVIKDDKLWESIAHHREVFTSLSGVDYTPDIRNRIVLLPPAEVRDVWEKDYKEMQTSMIYGSSLLFGELLDRISDLEYHFRNR